MLPRILKRLQDCIRERRYVVTLHAADEMDDDGVSILDVEAAMLNGEIAERQMDRETRERKYVVKGKTVDNSPLAVVTKFGATGKAIIITIFRED